MKVLVIGATGHFGGRFCRRILGEAAVDLIVSSRRAESASELAAQLRSQLPTAVVRVAQLDHASGDFEHALEKLRPDLVVHTAGPYQGQGYRVAEACLQVGCHYIDLADGREFVSGFRSLDTRAKEQGVLLVSGASTLPGLSSAVIEEVRDNFAEIHAIETSIAPAHQTPRGIGTVAAVLSYCGRSFSVLSNAQWISQHGWQNLRLQRYPDIGTRIAGACDVPDLALFPNYVPGVRTVVFHAALEAWWEQLSLWMMAWLSRAGVVKNWQQFAPTFRSLSQRLVRFGSDVGGMQMRLTGVDSEGHDTVMNWNLVAAKNHGPEIPCVPAVILTRKLARGTEEKRGAHPCLGFMTLAEFDDEVSDLDIRWGVSKEGSK